MSETDNVEAEGSMLSAEAPVDGSQSGTVDRPDWLPEKFKTPEDLVTSYSSLESKLGKGEEELRKTLAEEMLQETYKDRPETVGDYVLPEVLSEEEAVDNQLLNWWSQFCYDHGYGQDKFADGIQKYAEALNGDMPDLDAERARLGENADARIESVQLWANKFFDESQMGALERLGQTAEGIEVLEKVMDALKGSGIDAGAESGSQLTEADLRGMMNDERYWKQGARDTAFIKQVQDGFSKLYR